MVGLGVALLVGVELGVAAVRVSGKAAWVEGGTGVVTGIGVAIGVGIGKDAGVGPGADASAGRTAARAAFVGVGVGGLAVSPQLAATTASVPRMHTALMRMCMREYRSVDLVGRFHLPIDIICDYRRACHLLSSNPYWRQVLRPSALSTHPGDGDTQECNGPLRPISGVLLGSSPENGRISLIAA